MCVPWCGETGSPPLKSSGFFFLNRGFFGGRGIARPPSSSHPRCVHQQRRCVLRRRKDWHLSLPPHIVEEFSGGGGIGPPPHISGEYFGGGGIGPPPHISGEYFGGGGTDPPPHNVGEYFGGEGTGPSPHNVAVYISLGLQLTARALEAMRFWWIDLRIFYEPPGVHFSRT